LVIITLGGNLAKTFLDYRIGGFGLDPLFIFFPLEVGGPLNFLEGLKLYSLGVHRIKVIRVGVPTNDHFLGGN